MLYICKNLNSQPFSGLVTGLVIIFLSLLSRLSLGGESEVIRGKYIYTSIDSTNFNLLTAD